MKVTLEQRKAHDALLAAGVDLKSHPDDCPICATKEDLVTTYTEDELQAKVATAVADATSTLEAKVAAMEAAGVEAATASAIAGAVAEATAPLDEQVSDLQGKLDAAEAARKAAEDALAERVTADEETARKAAEDAVKAERLQAMTDIGLFGEQHLKDNAARWAEMTDEQWVAQVAEYQALKDSVGTTPPPPPPSGSSPITAAADVGNPNPPSAVRKVLDQRAAGVDLTKIH